MEKAYHPSLGTRRIDRRDLRGLILAGEPAESPAGAKDYKPAEKHFANTFSTPPGLVLTPIHAGPAANRKSGFSWRLALVDTATIMSAKVPVPSANPALQLEDTPKIHNLVVCTLCSYYPWPVLGLPPVWYKSAPYRSRAVTDPRDVLREFGLELTKQRC